MSQNDDRLNDPRLDDDASLDDAHLDKTAEEEEAERLQAERRPVLDQAVEMEVHSSMQGGDESPVEPVRLGPDDTFTFRCHSGVSCWNACCHNPDITLTPKCMLRLSRRLNMRPADVLDQYTVPAEWGKSDMPVAKLKVHGPEKNHACPFNTPEGCTVYEDRPATCRYYPLGRVTARMEEGTEKQSFYFLVNEAHCMGHNEDKVQTVDEFREEQGIVDYDPVNEGWIDILMKMVSWNSVGGPFGRRPSQQTKKMFYMMSYDVEAFRRFVFETKFLETYEIDPEAIETLRTDDEALLKLGFDWMRHTLFAEPTIQLKEEVLKQAVAQQREDLGAS